MYIFCAFICTPLYTKNRCLWVHTLVNLKLMLIINNVTFTLCACVRVYVCACLYMCVRVCVSVCVLVYLIQMFILDNVQLHANCGSLVGRHCTSGKQRYVTIESELQNDPKWPPVCNQSIDLAAIFQRHEDFHQGHSEQVSADTLT